MAKRHGISRRVSGRYFTATAGRPHGRNLLGNPMRGGIRL